MKSPVPYKGKPLTWEMVGLLIRIAVLGKLDLEKLRLTGHKWAGLHRTLAALKERGLLRVTPAEADTHVLPGILLAAPTYKPTIIGFRLATWKARTGKWATYAGDGENCTVWMERI